jgi:hypothetical protein
MEIKRPECEAHHYLSPASKIRMTEALTPFPHTQRNDFICTFLLLTGDVNIPANSIILFKVIHFNSYLLHAITAVTAQEHAVLPKCTAQNTSAGRGFRYIV